MDEDGRLDILLQKQEGDLSYVECVYNNYVKDAFFVKAMMVTGGNGETGIGSSYRLIATDLNDNKFVITSS